MRDFRAAFILVSVSIMIVAGCGGGGESGTPVVKATVSGTVLDSRNNPVPAATVTINSTPVTTTTDSSGNFSAQVETGDHEIIVEKAGHSVFNSSFSAPSGSPVDLGSLISSGYYPAYLDSDGDGYGDSDNATAFSTDSLPASYVEDSTDCDDSLASVNPGAAEACNQVDDDCDIFIDEGFDGDGDGYTSCGGDCDDGSAAVNPGASETCNGIDDNCAGGIDEGVLLTFYQDSDSDGYGDNSATTAACSAPSGYVADNSDCDDSSGAVNPGATEVCNGVDDNCADGIDDGVLLTFYQDSDTDGYGDPSIHLDACMATGVFVDNSLDCDDTDEFINPDATEVCDGVDNNCTAGVDEGLTTTYFLDFDEDTYGDPLVSSAACSQPAGYVADNSDCDDADGSVNPDGIEVCDDKDNDCSGTADEGLLTTYYEDFDSDTYGNAAVTAEACTTPAGYVSDNSDCDDTAQAVNPAATEICDGVDNNCADGVDEGLLLTWYQDSDTDTYGNASMSSQACTAPAGYVSDSTDCDDTVQAVNPGETEICDGLDNNCADGIDEGLLTTYYVDSDSDSFGDPLSTPQDACTAPSGYVTDLTDCDDTTAAVNPAAAEVCDGIDNNCVDGVDEGLTVTYYRDWDLDNYGDPLDSLDDCSQPSGYITNNEDCDDADPDINPETVWYADSDADQWPTSAGSVTQCTSPGGGSVPGHTFTLFDCDDTTGTLSPGNLEIQGNTIDDDCNSNTSDNLTAYNLSDLAGTWNIFGINAGDYASSQWNGWMEGFIAFNDQGEYRDFSLTYDDGTTDTTPSFDQLWINPGGIITTTQAPEMHGALSQDKDTIVATFTDEEGGHSMYILQKTATAITLNNFAGLWYQSALAAGDTPGWSGWSRGTAQINLDGNMFFQINHSNELFEGGRSSFEMDLDGALIDPEKLLQVSPDGQMIVGRGFYKGGYVLTTLIQSGGAFLPGNLEGGWSFHVLSAGDAPEINGWGHGMIDFDAAGNGLVNFQTWSDPTAVIDLGTLSVDGEGTLQSSVLPDFEGHLSRNKDTITATFTNDSGGDSMLVALRRDKPALGIVPEEHNSVSAVIGSAGGMLQAFSDDGVQFDLAIPPYALGDTELEVTVKMTPLSAVNELPVSGTYLGAVQLSPEGLQLVETAALFITVPQVLTIGEPLTYAYQGPGDNFHFMPLMPHYYSTTATTTSLLVPVEHFSGAGAGIGNALDISDLVIDLGSNASSAGAHYRNQVASVIADMVAADVYSFTHPDSGPFLARIKLIMPNWFDSYVYPRLLFAETIEDMRRAIFEYVWWHTTLGEVNGLAAGLDYSDRMGQADTAVNNTISGTIDDLDTQCMDAIERVCPPVGPCEVTGDICAGTSFFLRAYPWIEYKNIVNNFGYFPSVEEYDFTDFCGNIGSSIPEKGQFLPEYTGLQVTQEGTLHGWYKTFLEPDPRELLVLTSWNSPSAGGSSAVVSVAGGEGPFSTTVTGLQAGIALVSGYDANSCGSQNVVVEVGDPFSGLWNITQWKESNDICHPPPPQARPETISVLMDLDELTWRHSGPGFYYQMIGTMDMDERKGRIDGGSLSEQMQQHCDISLNVSPGGLAEMKGKCSYIDYNNGVFGDGSLGDICIGDWEFTARRPVF